MSLHCIYWPILSQVPLLLIRHNKHSAMSRNILFLIKRFISFLIACICMHVHLYLCLCLCFDRGQRCLVHREELSSYKSLGVGAGQQIWVLWGSSTCSQWLNHLSSPMKYFWWPPRRVGGNIWNQKKLFRPSFQLPIYRKYKDCKIMLKSTKSSEPNTHCWHPTVKMPYTFLNELYKGHFITRKCIFPDFLRVSLCQTGGEIRSL